jgi:hypothetical protein
LILVLIADLIEICDTGNESKIKKRRKYVTMSYSTWSFLTNFWAMDCNIQAVSKLNGKTSGMDSSYTGMKKRVWQHGSRNVWLQSCPNVYLLSAHRHVLIAGINCETPGTIVKQVIKFRINLMWAWIPLKVRAHDILSSPVK